MSFEIRQGEVLCLREQGEAVLQKLNSLSQKTTDSETYLTADFHVMPQRQGVEGMERAGGESKREWAMRGS